MSEKEKKIMETIAKVLRGAPAPTKDYLLGWAEGAAAVVCSPRSDATTPESAEGM